VGDYREALVNVNKARDINVHIPDVYFLKGLIYDENNNVEKAIENFQIAVEKKPDYYDAYILLGLLYSGMKDSLAIDYYNNALEISPNSIEANYYLALFYQENNRIEEAIKKYSFIITNLNHQDANSYHNLGFIYLEYKNEYSNAISYFDTAVSINPSFIEALFNRSYTYEKIEDYNKARVGYKNVLQLNPDYSLAIDALNRLDELTP